MSINAPESAEHAALDAICESFMVIVSGTPALTAPVVGSDRRSERLSLSSTKYGPSVSDGVTTHDEFVDVDDEEDEGDVGELLLDPHPRNPTATNDPNAYKTSRRPTANSSESFMVLLPLLRDLPQVTAGQCARRGQRGCQPEHCRSRVKRCSDRASRRLFVTDLSGRCDTVMKNSLHLGRREIFVEPSTPTDTEI